MDIYWFNREVKGAWQQIDVFEIPPWYKFVAWVYPEKTVLIVFKVIQSHKDMAESAVRNDIDDICANREPNAAGLCRNGRITEWHSTTLNLSSDGDAITAIRKFLKK